MSSDSGLTVLTVLFCEEIALVAGRIRKGKSPHVRLAQAEHLVNLARKLQEHEAEPKPRISAHGSFHSGNG